eukprot:CAMPEP_0167761690 /NCGR_PEP_ID=MMETSP0110_2-20121227/12319_1 /TAXON_ID=629695 /ORGANISM="Gymnochlora sp., Strain CCMP2014" /LENGTH=282 /DNA_ID=CAMNT_0007648415 /DNA_START=13 /DNA_END=858 /DNA_ORIENTATION=+
MGSDRNEKKGFFSNRKTKCFVILVTLLISAMLHILLHLNSTVHPRSLASTTPHIYKKAFSKGTSVIPNGNTHENSESENDEGLDELTPLEKKMLNVSNWSNGETGFPGALTLEEAALCDPKTQAVLKGEPYVCAEDVTCLMCQEEGYTKKFNEQLKTWMDSEHTKERKAIYEKFRSQELVIIQAVNTGQLHLWLNWVCSCEANGINPRDITIMLPSDENAYNMIKKSGFVAVKPPKYDIDPNWGGRQGRQGHTFVNNMFVLTARELLALGHEVILHDVDIVW